MCVRQMNIKEAIKIIEDAYGLWPVDGPDIRGTKGKAWDILRKVLSESFCHRCGGDGELFFGSSGFGLCPDCKGTGKQ